MSMTFSLYFKHTRDQYSMNLLDIFQPFSLIHFLRNQSPSFPLWKNSHLPCVLHRNGCQRSILHPCKVHLTQVGHSFSLREIKILRITNEQEADETLQRLFWSYWKIPGRFMDLMIPMLASLGFSFFLWASHNYPNISVLLCFGCYNCIHSVLNNRILFLTDFDASLDEREIISLGHF